VPDFLIAAIDNIGDMYSFQTAATIGGVIFQGVATPDPQLSGKEIDLRYNPHLPDGERLEITIGGEKFKSETLLDWALIPISNYANSPYTAVVSLLGKPQPGEEGFDLSHRRRGRSLFWVQIHPDLKDTLVGFNALLTDAMFLIGDPATTRTFTQSLRPRVSRWNRYRFDESKSADAAKTLKGILDVNRGRWNTYIFNDLDSGYTFRTMGDQFVISGRRPMYHFLNVDLARETVDPQFALIDAFRSDDEALLALNYAVYITTYRTAMWAEFFRHMKATQPAKWKSYLESLEQATGVLAVETPVAWLRKH
jgi:hypothetical protein